MGFLRIRTTVDERPGRLAALTAAIAAKGGNILGLSVQPDAEGTVDEFVAELPGENGEQVAAAIESAGGRRTVVVAATAHDLVDEPTRALLLAARLAAAPWRLPDLLAELLRADHAGWSYGEPSALPDPHLLLVPVAERRAVRLRRAELPFTMTEAARAAAFARLATREPSEPQSGERVVHLADETELQVRPLTAQFREAVRDLHDRCSPESRRFRYFTSMPTLPPQMFDRMLDKGRGQSMVACHDGQVVALASLMYCPEPGVGELALLIEDRWQGRGLGALLARILVTVARDAGLAEVRARLISDNVRMRRLMIRLGATILYTDDPGVIEARLPVTAVIEPRA